ncbi:hypothetical protein FACS1894166_02710 [Bacilli bacterium]|nr:hypothetical protein FACS1894166_02710 [Bacilli bacterium]
MSNEYVKIIKSTYKDAFLSHAGEGTSIAYILSEFLDNSITGYEQLQELSRKDKHDYRGLNINITFHRTDKGEEITIQDNGSGIIDTSGKNNPRKYLGEVMQPYFHNVKDQDKSQYGVGMKLAIF